MITISNVSHRYFPTLLNKTNAISSISATITPGSITGLLGPNASGKTTLLRILSGQIPQHEGDILYYDTKTDVSLRAANSLYIADGSALPTLSITNLKDIFSSRTTFDDDLFAHLCSTFELPSKGAAGKLSTGKKSALAASLTLASGAPITIFDETQSGMDVATRRAFYQEIVSINQSTGRTFILSTHIISELEPLIENVLIMQHGHLKMSGSVDDLRERFITYQGPTEIINTLLSQVGDQFTATATSSLGPMTAVTGEGAIPNTMLKPYGNKVMVTNVPFEDAFLSLTSRS